MFRLLPPLLHLCLALTFCFVTGARAQDGLFADFATSLGNFTCQLHFDRAPQTVANFVSLATGERAWLDLRTGEASRRPFYNGITFHRVVRGFVIQGGSPNGNGTDGPGYTFRDEFHPTLRHSKAGILSMANSGPHSNGSQFFVTLAPTTHLDDLHSVFGEVTSGMDVVLAIGEVPVGANSKPVTPVVMNSVTIRRVGSAALAFNASAQGLPTVGGAGPELIRNGTSGFALRFPRALYNEYLLYRSDDLATWISERLGLYVTTPPTIDLDVTASAAGKARHFWRVPQIAYPGPLFTPPSLIGKRLRLTLTSGELLEYTINSTGGGTSMLTTTQGTTSGTFTTHSWLQEAYRGRFSCATTNITPITVSLVFANETSGTFKGSTQSGSPLAGTFTLDNPIAGFSNTTSPQRTQKRLAKPRTTTRATNTGPLRR